MDGKRIVRVNIGTQEVFYQEPKAEYRFLGGRGLTSRFLLDEVEPTTCSLGPENKMIIAPGLLGGTGAPCSGRLSIGSKSPLTGGIKESNSGGTAGGYLARLGIKALIIEGGKPAAGEWFLLKVDRQGAELLPGGDLAGLGNYEVAERLQARFGEKAAVISIGPAGERLLPLATAAITNMEGQPSRHCGRGGMGAVLGAKGIKAIVICPDGGGQVPAADRAGFREIVREWSRSLVQGRKILTEYGTANLVEPMNALGCLPTRNFSAGSFEAAEQISGSRLKELTAARGGKTGHPCHPGCVIRCSNIYHDEDGNYLTSGLEYETIGLMGANCGIDSLDTIARLDRFCDDFGIDTMEMGDTLAVAMEAGVVEFGDGEGALGLLQEIKNDTILGKVLGQGTRMTGRVLGVKRIPTVKGQGLSAYDPRGMKGTGVTYATSPMGADHTAGNALPGRTGFRPETTGKFDTHSAAGQVGLSRDLQILTAVADVLGFCFFVGVGVDNMDVFARLLTAATGEEWDRERVIDLGRNAIGAELAFNRGAGFSNVHDRLPDFFRRERLKPHDLVFDVDQEELNAIWNDLG